jgi:hypothetical protein
MLYQANETVLGILELILSDISELPWVTITVEASNFGP